MGYECWQLVADRSSMPSKFYSVAMIQAFSAKRFLLNEGRTILGRDETGCDIVLPGAHVSRQHAELIINDGVVKVRDLGSSNGTFVNGRAIQEILVEPGDQICFDTITLTLFAPDQDPDQTVIYSRPSAHEDEGTLMRDAELEAQLTDDESSSRLKEAQWPLSRAGSWRKKRKGKRYEWLLDQVRTVMVPVGILIASVATICYAVLG